MKIGWFSKAGKITCKVILGIIIWVFFIIGVAITWISCLQWGDENEAPNVYEMVENFKYDHWLWIYNDNNDDSFGRFIDLESDWEDKVIAIDDNFTQWEWEWRQFFIKFPTNSKFFNRGIHWEAIYGDEVDEHWNRVETWIKIHEIKIEVSSGSFIQSLWTPLARNPGKNHFWQKNSWVIDGPERFSKTTPWAKEWETMCIILTPQNPITQTEISLHDEWCEFWSLPVPVSHNYEEIYLPVIIAGNEWKDNSNIKVSHITVDMPYYNN